MTYVKGKAKVVRSSSDKLRTQVMNAIGLLSKIVGSTLGPGGRVVLIEREGLPPLATKDGVSVAKSINFTDAIDNIVVECVKEVAERTGKEAGDGTTTSIILADAIVRHGIQYLQTHPTISPQAFVRQIRADFDKLATCIASKSLPVETDERMKHVALISSNGDEEVASAVVDAILKSGEDGAVILEESSSVNTYTLVKEGFALPKGLDFLGSIGSVFINNQKDMECVLDRPVILFFNGTLRDVSWVNNVITPMNQKQDVRPIIIVAHDFADDVKEVFALNTKQGAIKLVPVITPRDGTALGKELVLQDLAAYCNGEIFDPTNLKDVKLDSLGDCDKFRMSRWQTVFMGTPDQEAIADRIETIKKQINHIDKELDAEIYRERIARLTGGVTTIYVGGRSDLEIREVKARVEDAICAVRASLKEGVVPGGAATLYRLANEDVHEVLKAALKQPIINLLDNAGMLPDEIKDIVAMIEKDSDTVYDVLNSKSVNAWDAGIVDPAKVISSAIGNAISVASTLVTLGGVVVVARDETLERQMELSDNAFDNMMRDQ